MNYSCEEEYNDAMSGQGEAEAQMMQEYQDYLCSLIKDGKYELYAIESVLDLINERYRESDGKTITEFLIEMKLKIINAKQQTKKPLPF